jgi:hypothetical protein
LETAVIAEEVPYPVASAMVAPLGNETAKVNPFEKN